MIKKFFSNWFYGLGKLLQITVDTVLIFIPLTFFAVLINYITSDLNDETLIFGFNLLFLIILLIYVPSMYGISFKERIYIKMYKFFRGIKSH